MAGYTVLPVGVAETPTVVVDEVVMPSLAVVVNDDVAIPSAVVADEVAISSAVVADEVAISSVVVADEVAVSSAVIEDDDNVAIPSAVAVDEMLVTSVVVAVDDEGTTSADNIDYNDEVIAVARHIDDAAYIPTDEVAAVDTIASVVVVAVTVAVISNETKLSIQPKGNQVYATSYLSYVQPHASAILQKLSWRNGLQEVY